MKFNLIVSAAHSNISGGDAAHYIKRLDIPGLVLSSHDKNKGSYKRMNKKVNGVENGW